MKPLKYLPVIIFTLCLTACSEDFIELAPISEGNTDNFYQTPADFEAAIIAAYANLASANQYGSNDTRFGGSFYALMEVRADDVTEGEATSGVGREVFEIDTFEDNPLSSVISGAWNSIFKTVFDANVIVSRIDNITIDQNLKNQYLAEARFLRALSYFNAVRLWGDLPIILQEITPQEAYGFSRQPINEVYQAIEEDLIFASQNLSSSAIAGRATSGAAKTLLGKVFLTQQKWSEATNILSEVISSYQLLANIEDVFELDNENNGEIIFSVKFRSGADDVGHLGFGTPMYNDLATLYDASDLRLPLLDLLDNNNGTYPRKQFEISSSELGRDFPVLRYADVILMHAEALNEMGYQANGEAFYLLNQIRTRAGLPNYTSSDLTNQVEFRDAILLERRLELPLELHRWFDLLRTNTAVQAIENIGGNIAAYQLLFPIPQEEISVYNNPSTFPQNDGY